MNIEENLIVVGVVDEVVWLMEIIRTSYDADRALYHSNDDGSITVAGDSAAGIPANTPKIISEKFWNYWRAEQRKDYIGE